MRGIRPTPRGGPEAAAAGGRFPLTLSVQYHDLHAPVLAASLLAGIVGQWSVLTEAHRLGKLPAELTRLRRYGLIIIDEVGYLPFEQDAANLVFQLVSSRYEHASLILTSNLPFSAWGGVFGDQAVAAAMIDRIVHHADVLTLKGASYRLRNRGIDTLPSIRTTTSDTDN